MANPIAFQPKPHNPLHELQKRLEAAPAEHAEALLECWDLLEVAHRKGVLGMLVGAIGSKNAIAGQIAAYAKEPVSTQALRNALSLAQVLGSIDPDMLARLVKAVTPVPSFYATSEAEAAHQLALNPVTGTGGETVDPVRRARYEHRGDDAKVEPGRASLPRGENSGGSPSSPELQAKAERERATRNGRRKPTEDDQLFDMSGEPPSLWQLFRRFTGKDARRGLAMAANAITTVGRTLRE